MNRRDFLRSVAAFGGLAVGPKYAPSAQTSPAAVLDKGFARVEKIADGVYATIADFTKGPQAVSNGGVIVGRDAVLIVEGHLQHAGAALEIEAARVVSKAPIRGAVNTHYHFDHTFGNAQYQDERIPILAHDQAVTLMKQRYVDLQGSAVKSMVPAAERRLANAASDVEKKRAQGDLGLITLMAESVDKTRIVLPTEPLPAGSLPRRIDLGGLTAVIEYQPGHTSTDIIVRVPQRDVVFTGDLLFNGIYPVAFDASMRAWRGVLDGFTRLGRGTKFVPGHGAVCGVDVVKQQMSILDDLRAHAERSMKAGLSADEAQKRYEVPARFQSFTIFWAFSVAAAIARYYEEMGVGAQFIAPRAR